MPQVKAIKDGLTIAETSEGFEVTQPFLIFDLPENKVRPLSDAVNVTGLPRYGDPYGRWGISVTARKFTPTDEMKNACICEITYSKPDESQSANPNASGAFSPGKTEMQVSTVNEKTYFDRNGDLMTVRYRGIATGNALGIQAKEADIVRPVFRFKHVRTETSIPFLKSKQYTGKINSTPIWGFNARELLILGVTNSEQNKGVNQEVTYDFAYDARTWRFDGSFTINGGFVPDDATPGNGIEFFDVLDEIDFAPLGLNIILE